ncbi:MAG: hypothetical protein HOO67_00460 [Candidatus Peribacteraceae bacterium]|nr:hypothetical protein [Candidatus Peribacteraceae bacterium]
MIIRYAPAFRRMYKKLLPEQQELVDQAIVRFTVDPFDRRLHNHKLVGSKKDVRSFSAAYDLRILYTEEKGHAVVLLLMVGDHKTVY